MEGVIVLELERSNHVTPIDPTIRGVGNGAALE